MSIEALSVEKRLATLEREVGELRDIEAIKQLRWDYSRACDDDHNADWLIPMFTETGEIILNEPFSGTVKGHADLRQMFENNAEVNGITWTLHYYLQPLIKIADNGLTATGNWYLWELAVMPNDQGKEEPIWVAGEYLDEYVKEDDRWKFSRIEVNINLLSPYSDGWVKNRVRGVHQH